MLFVGMCARGGGGRIFRSAGGDRARHQAFACTGFPFFFFAEPTFYSAKRCRVRYNAADVSMWHNRRYDTYSGPVGLGKVQGRGPKEHLVKQRLRQLLED
jgi:hypothetical protein